jgi:N-acetylmuramoyl-L-alanine amidase
VLASTVCMVAAWSLSVEPAAQSTLPPAVGPKVSQPESGGAWSAQVRARPATSAKAAATAIRITGDGKRTRVRLEITSPVVASLFTLDAPYRAVIDVADLDFKIAGAAGPRARGLIKDYRYGQFLAGRSRVVIDLIGPARIENAALAPAQGRESAALVFDLAPISDAEFKAIVAGTPPPSETDASLRGGRHDDPAASASQAGPPSVPRSGPKSRPVVVIDPGHGGIDPGAVASSTVTEKMVTLAVGLQLRALLLQAGRYDVRLTRETDTFVSLDQRVRFSRQHAADLFVSIHADALAEPGLAQAVRGATVYVLADRASDEAARRLAEKENAADVLAGLAAMPASVEDQVRSILLDLVQRETANYALSFRSLVVSQLRGKVPLAKDPNRSAAFRVLRQPETPAVLIELGYMSNAEDLARLSRSDGQKQLAAAIAAAVDAYFAKRDARSGR